MIPATSGVPGSKDHTATSGNVSSGGSGGGTTRSGATESLRQHLQGKFQARAVNSSSSSSLPSSISLGGNSSSKSDNPPLNVKSSPNSKRNRGEKNQKSSTSVGADSRSVKDKMTSGKDSSKEKGEETPFKVNISASSTKPQSPNRHQNVNNNVGTPSGAPTSSSSTLTASTTPNTPGTSNGQPSVRVKFGNSNDLPSNEIHSGSSGSNYTSGSGKVNPSSVNGSSSSNSSSSNSSNNNSSNSSGPSSSIGKNNKSVPSSSSSSSSAFAKSGRQLGDQQQSDKSNNSSSATGSSSVSSGGDEAHTHEDVSISVPGKKEPVRGRAWRDQLGVYTKYKCFGDGVMYKPGGNFTSFHIGFRTLPFSYEYIYVCI